MASTNPRERHPAAPPASPDGESLLQLIEDVAAELHPGRRRPATMDSSLEDDLGLDSLARMELLLRIQRRFGLTLPERQALGAETPADLMAALSAARQGRPASPSLPPPKPRATSTLASALPSQTATLIDALAWYAERDPDRVHVEICESDETTTAVSYRELHDDARRLAAGLVARDIPHGAAVALMLPTGRDFFVAFLGIQLAGAVPVPIYPPFRASQLEDHLRRQALILENARAVLLIGSIETARAARWLRHRLVDLRAVATVDELSHAGDASMTAPRPSDVALIQYTSGSTGDPKGVVLTHANLLANVRAIGDAVDVQPDDVVVSWLPLYHDMGLIGAWFASLYYGRRLIVMPPTRFLAQPTAWLRALHRHRGTLTAAPNFAYEICASRLRDEDLAGLDLSAWRLALNGSEPVSPGTIDRFARRFAPYGFRPEAMTPVYGLAENAVALAFTPAGRGPRIDRVERAAFEAQGRATPASETSPGALAFVSSGRPVARHEVRVVDDLGRELPDRRLGQVQFRGPSATRGYFRNEPATRALRDGDWLNTGDLGYVADGELYVTGRSKDVIIRAGRHVFPYEVEELVGAIPGIRQGGVAVFSSHDERRGTEKLVIVAEARERSDERLADLREEIDKRAATILGAAPEEILLVPPRAIPKTSSGKTRRAACRDLYLRGTLGHTKSLRRQMLDLAFHLGAPLLRRGLRAAAALAYAGWFWLCLALLLLPALIFALTIPGDRLRWRAVSAVARLFFLVAGIPLVLHGREHLAGGARVLVVNHASYIDSVALVALLPFGFSIVAKRELEGNVFLRRALRRLGVLFVERFDRERAVQEVGALEEQVRHDKSLLVFPEGTNRRIPGLFPFHLGAFLVAAHAGAPVVPGGITGSRTVLRADQWFPRRGPITVTFRPPLGAQGSEWEDAVALRDRSRGEVATAAQEPLVG